MLTDPKEIKIISRARQKNVRNPERSRVHFENIINDFFKDNDLSGRFLDMGPGQYDFGEIIRQHGGECICIESDPAVIELGKYKGFEVIQENIQNLVERPLPERFDGIFNKFTFNAFWNWDDDLRHKALIGSLVNMINTGGWCWCGPWNGIPKKADFDRSQIDHILKIQRTTFESYGFNTITLSKEESRRYGLQGNVASHVIFYKNLHWQPK